MLLSRKWLDEFVHVDANDKDFAEAMTLSGSKVETTEDRGAEISNIVVGTILTMERHPDSDHMWICQLDVGQSAPIQIVTGAWNIHPGDMVPVALDHSTLPGGKKMDIHYIYRTEDADKILMLDRSQIEQVLINLLKNAGEACIEQEIPEVIIATHYEMEKRIFMLTVTDNGSGILPDVLDKIFVPFFTTKPTGSGIGLSLCKQIMNLHGGSISVSSEIGKGSCFSLKFLCK